MHYFIDNLVVYILLKGIFSINKLIDFIRVHYIYRDRLGSTLERSVSPYKKQPKLLYNRLEGKGIKKGLN